MFLAYLVATSTGLTGINWATAITLSDLKKCNKLSKAVLHINKKTAMTNNSTKTLAKSDIH